jgi:magnesium-transporting ATPase (P-type)
MQEQIDHLSRQTLGSVSVIAFDKTGILTRIQMTATAIALDARPLNDSNANVIGAGCDLYVAAFCNEADSRQGSSAENTPPNSPKPAIVGIGRLRRSDPLIRIERRERRSVT